MKEIFSRYGIHTAKYIILKNKKELIECIYKCNEFTPKKFVSNKKSFNELIINYIEKM